MSVQAPATIPLAPVDPDAVWPILLPTAIIPQALQMALRVPTSGPYAFGAARRRGRRTAGVTIFRPPGCSIVYPAHAQLLEICFWENSGHRIDAAVLHADAGYYLIIGGFADRETRYQAGLRESTARTTVGGVLGFASALRGATVFVQYVAGEALTPADFRTALEMGELRLFDGREPSPLLRDPTAWLQAAAAKAVAR